MEALESVRPAGAGVCEMPGAVIATFSSVVAC